MHLGRCYHYKVRQLQNQKQMDDQKTPSKGNKQGLFYGLSPQKSLVGRLASDLISRHYDVSPFKENIRQRVNISDPKLISYDTPVKLNTPQIFYIEDHQAIQSQNCSSNSSQENDQFEHSSQIQNSRILITERKKIVFEPNDTPRPRKSPAKIRSNRTSKRLSKRGQQKVVTCNCKKSLCLKLYCDCYAQGKICSSSCNCFECHNNDQHQVQRIARITYHIDRNPHSFDPKVQDGEELGRHTKGCNCKKSMCQKKYCECYQAGVRCSGLCKCEQCKNLGEECRKRRKLT